jgi:Fe-S cluster assembly protein SufD
MIAVTPERDPHLAHFADLGRRRSPLGPPWIRTLQQDALARFLEKGFPRTDEEDWRFTSLLPIARSTFEVAPAQVEVPPEALSRYAFEGVPGPRVVFVNGRWAPGLSSLAHLPEGVGIGGLADLLERDSGGIQAHLNRLVGRAPPALVALNGAFLEDGAVVLVSPGVILEDPIQIVFLSGLTGVSPGSGPATLSQPRTLIVAGRESQLKIVETWAGLGATPYWTNAVTELVAGENAIVDHYRLVREGEKAFHTSTLAVEQAANARVALMSISTGGALIRNDVGVLLDGEGAECSLDGLYLASGDEHVDNHTVIDHARPHGTSREFYKGILDGRSRAVFNGRIIVRPGAQKTDARQTNKNLLLSEEALANSNPQLEIYADDVKCTHGATIGQLDGDAIFYLRSRGLDLAEARNLLTYAFVNDVQSRIGLAPLRSVVEAELFARLAASPPNGGGS